MGPKAPSRRLMQPGGGPGGGQEKVVADRRRRNRHRTRLRSGKIVSIEGRFLIECQFRDLADGGAQIWPVRDFEPPDRFWVFDDHERSVTYAEVVWRKGPGIGVSFDDKPQGCSISRERIAYLSRKYYGL